MWDGECLVRPSRERRFRWARKVPASGFAYTDGWVRRDTVAALARAGLVEILPVVGASAALLTEDGFHEVIDYRDRRM